MKKFTDSKLSRLSKVSLTAAVLLGSAATGMALINSGSDPITVDARSAQFNYRHGEVIVKFKRDSKVRIKNNSNGRFASSAVSEVDKLFQSLGVESVEPLMPQSGAAPVARKVRGYNGAEVQIKDLSTLYVVKMNQNIDTDIMETVARLKALSDVEYAEPNYIVHALETDFSQQPNDPLYNLQYGISAINLDQLWPMPVIMKDGPVIAILDTGVELDHPDLKQNIWTNPGEEGGASYYDDDYNGYKDDLHGWDFVNNTGEIYDYNGHGTHCAGIAAASGFNGTGIIGANPDARIMPLTVLQSNGQGDIGTLIKALDYAYANGADIISMSLGTYASSIAFEEALARAYSKCVLIGAAGNDGYCLNHPHLEKAQTAPMPMFPGAYTFVLGVQASSQEGGLAGFSNYDDNGPSFSAYSEEQLYNYELMVPGASITSTYPGGTYKALNGTSMATPLVAGAVSRLLQTKEYLNKEELFGDLINSLTPKGDLDIFAAYNIKPEDRIPELQFVTFEMVDEDGDGRADAGEEVAFYPVIRNAWGNVSNIKCSVECAELVNNTFSIIDTNVDFGTTLSSYGKAKSANPLKIKFNDGVADGRIVRLKFSALADNTATIEQEYEIMVENAETLTGILKDDMTLTADKHYVITGTFGVPEGVTLTIEPGTTLKLRDESRIFIKGNMIANGDPNNMIHFTKTELGSGIVNTLDFGKAILSYCKFDNLSINEDGFLLSNSNWCIFNNINVNWPVLLFAGESNHSNILISNCYSGLGVLGWDGGKIKFSNLVNCMSGYNSNTTKSGIFVSNQTGLFSSNVFNNTLKYSYSNARENMAFHVHGNLEVLNSDSPCYPGTSSKAIARERIVDINHEYNTNLGVLTEYDFSNTPTKPYAEAPGIVWKVVVNNYDAQDQFDEMPALGVGRHKFEVYFNRPMNKAKVPTIAMGVRPPYTQTGVGEEGTWNADGTIYTAYLTLSGKTNIDGLNRIYVAGAEDTNYFPIPVEDSRFNVMVQAAGSMSDEFYAVAGLGKVELNWESSELEIDDVLGYNIYRYNVDEEGNEINTTQINQRLIDDTDYVDYDVKPGVTYLYYYKTLRTDLTENSASKVVAATPLTAARGDANGSMKVEVGDVVAEISYILGGNPQPFIFDAADVNEDKNINVLDIVGTVNIINTPAGAMSSQAKTELSTAYFSVEDGILYVECDMPIAGLQVRLNGDRSKDVISKAGSFNGFEETANWLSDNEYLYMVFSMTGQTLTPGKYALLNISDARIFELIVSATDGANMPVEMKEGTNGIGDISAAGDLRVYPNPFGDEVNIDYEVAAPVKVFFTVNNLQGALVTKVSRIASEGKNTLTLNTSGLPSGVYFIRMIIDGKTVETFKAIKK